MAPEKVESTSRPAETAPQTPQPAIRIEGPLVEKLISQSRFGRAEVNGARHNCDKPRLTPPEKEALLKTRIFRDNQTLLVALSGSIDTGQENPVQQTDQPHDDLANLHLPENTWISYRDGQIYLEPSGIRLELEPTETSEAVDHPVAQTLKSIGEEVEVDPDVLDLMIEDQKMASSTYHFMETNYQRNNPHAPKSIVEEDLTEESNP